MAEDPRADDERAFAAAVAGRLAGWLTDLPLAPDGRTAPDPAALAAALGRFAAALRRENEQLNLTAIRDCDGMALRHLLDSLLAARVLEGTGVLADLGSGGGVPGLPLALALPERPVVLIESRRRKARALERLVAGLHLADRVSVVAERGETWLAGHPVDTVVTRAVGSLEAQLRLLTPVRACFRRLVLLKGPALDDELARAARRLSAWDCPDPERHDVELPGGAGRRTLLVLPGTGPGGLSPPGRSD